MSQKQGKTSVLASNPSASTRNGHPAPRDAEQVWQLIAGQHSKAALQLAKDLHKRDATAESEALLVDAYGARIGDLIRLRMMVEAKALFAIVRERFPGAVARLADIERDLCAIDGRLDEVVRPLQDPALAVEDRERIETFIRQRIDDLPGLAAVNSLPPEHPLRSAASALGAAFQAVTEGPVDDEHLTLAQVSRRNPLAPWKALVRAIACYYKHQDAECRKWLLTIANDDLPARLIPLFMAVLGTRTEVGFSPAETRLIASIRDQGAALRSSLAGLEEAFAKNKRQPILDGIRSVARAGMGTDSTVLERLRQHIAARCVRQHIPTQSVHAALGGPPRQDAYFFRLLARSLEEMHYPEAVIVWEKFRRAAIREKWFASGELEDGVLSLHMAEMAARLPADVVSEIEDFEAFPSHPGRGRKGAALPTAHELYERACQADACAEAFDAWLRWAKKQVNANLANDVAERWRKARPGDIQPLLHLMESAEKRSAFQKSLKYLAEAEQLDRLNPAVRRAKVQLLISAAVRHLDQGKTHLISTGVEQLLGVPEVHPGQISALVAVLRWGCAAIESDTPTRQEREAELSALIGPVAASLLISAVVRSAELRANVFAPGFDARGTPSAELLAGAVRACLLGDWAGLPIPLLFGWTGKLIEALKEPNGSMDVAQLLVLGEAALGDSARELAYAVSGAGLTLGNANARFLFLRARALPIWAAMRREGCLAAALELARRERDTELAGKILDRWDSSLGADPDALSAQVASEVVQEELKFKKFPKVARDDQPRYGPQLATLAAAQCDCPQCRADRGEAIDDWDDVEDEEDNEWDGPLMKGIPDALRAILAALPLAVRREIEKAIDAGENPIGILEKIDRTIRKISPGSASRASKWKPPKSPVRNHEQSQENAARDQQPEQGDLF